MSKITKEAAYAAMVRFVQEFGRYPTKHDYREVDYLFSPETSRRLIGGLRELTILEDFYKENPKQCLNCNGPVPFEKRHTNTFCSQSCNAVYHNSSRKKPQSEKKRNYGYVRFSDCQSCGKELSNNCTKYCSIQCQQDLYTSRRIALWEDGQHFSNRAIRKFLETLRGYKCEVCDISEWNGKPITLEVEHKDGNSEDSSPGNVCLICPNCHSQTDTYKGKNKGNGRYSRRQRYQDGKSY